MTGGHAAVDLFGMERPAHDEPSGGVTAAIGLVESAAGGTLVLDDVQLLDPLAQAALAETLAEGSFRRVGSKHRIETETRFIATAGTELPAAVRAGSFRADLFDSLGHVRIALPPLRERSVDIAILAQAFVREFGGLKGPSLASEAIEALQGYSWPGNLRELRNVLERAVLLAGGGIIHAHDLPLPAAVRSASSAEDAPLSLQEVERRHIAAVLQRTGWHQGKAASLLGISAKTLYRKIREYGFERPAGVGAP
jgi:DNA-binding NtrC family response regulator